jgi:putative membrane protein
MVEDHRKDVAEFKHQADHGNRQTAALAKKTLPVLQKHLKMAEALPQ